MPCFEEDLSSRSKWSHSLPRHCGSWMWGGQCVGSFPALTLTANRGLVTYAYLMGFQMALEVSRRHRKRMREVRSLQVSRDYIV